MNFTTSEEGNCYYVGGSVFVVALVEKATLKLRGYLKEVFLTEDDAEEALRTNTGDSHIAYIIQEKPLYNAIGRIEE